MGKPAHKRVAKPSTETTTPPTPLNSTTPSLLDRAPTSTAPSPTALHLPLHHFLSKVSLQLLAILFILSSAASNATANSSLAPPALLRSLVAALVEQPGKTLSTTCTGVAVVQIWYGLWASGLRKAHAAGPVTPVAAGERAPKKGFKGALSEMLADAKRGKAPQLQNMQTTKGKAPFDFDLNYIGVAGMMTTAAAVALHGCAVLLGAPLFTRVKETFLLSFLVAQLAIAPVALAVPYTERYVWLRMFSSFAPANDLELALVGPAFGTVIGCWLGAIPIPLDWDRPWQAWPTTCVLGAVLGHVVGTGVSVALVSRNAAAAAAAAAGEVSVGEETKKDK